jgi:hypothetical protein
MPVTARVHAAAGSRHLHAAWESQPLVRSVSARRLYPASIVTAAALAGLILGVML